MLDFTKMHGLGNDFVVFDGRNQNPGLTAATCQTVADRRHGIGCDQILTILPPRHCGEAYIQIHNPDGSEAEACGNGSRCVAALLMDQTGRETVTIETIAGSLVCKRRNDGQITVDMGSPRFDWRDIPLARSSDTLHVPLRDAPADDCCCVNLGNPHAVFLVDDIDAVPLPEIGPVLERHPMFPERANIEFATVLTPDRIRMRVWERAAGITRACGSGACAVLVAAIRRGRADRTATIVLDGGELVVEWTQTDRVLMTGPASTSFFGKLDLDTLPN